MGGQNENDATVIRNAGGPPRSVTKGFEVASLETLEQKVGQRTLPAPGAQSREKNQQKPASVRFSDESALSAQLSGQSPSAPGQPERKSQKQMTKAERREKQDRDRAEKAKRLAAKQPGSKQPGSAAAAGFAAHHAHSSASDMKQPSPNANALRVASSMRLDDPKKRQKAQKQQSVDRQLAQKPVGLFSHLPQYEKHDNIQARLKKQENIHPIVLSLGLKYQNFTISGGNARCMAMLEAFKRVISDYVTPSGTSLPRHLPSVISKQVDLLSNTRVLAASMKTAIRELKKEIAVISVDTSDENAKERLLLFIENFKTERIWGPGQVIADQALSNNKIQDGDVILTFGHSSTVLKLLLHAHEEKLQFKVFVADGRPKLEGKEMLKTLVAAGIKCGYTVCSAVPLLMKEVSKVIIGASAVLGNGAILSRVGTAVVCNAAKERQVPVIVVCESYKFLDETRLDSFTWNEIGNPDDLVDISNRGPSEYTLHTSTAPPQNQSAGRLAPWRNLDKLKLLNLHYDVTPAHFITALICEHGIVPSTCALSIARLTADRTGTDF
ncbi:Eukaryotic translation initiation factor 2B, subunit 4 delta, 67kDa [Geranomyces variabilis]|nr:Eukaryotic translation initiation factor 2B, subunit 4 delta, 67kDa [Geranomyces variabilis]